MQTPKGNADMAEATVKVKNRLGLHLRAATTLAQEAAKFTAAINLERGKHRVSARSVTALLMLGAGKGTTLKVKAEGPDAQAAVAKIKQLFDNGFGEE